VIAGQVTVIGMVSVAGDGAPVARENAVATRSYFPRPERFHLAGAEVHEHCAARTGETHERIGDHPSLRVIRRDLHVHQLARLERETRGLRREFRDRRNAIRSRRLLLRHEGRGADRGYERSDRDEPRASHYVHG